MWRIPKPVITALEAFDTCRAGISTPELAQRLEEIREDIAEAEAEFDAAATLADLLQIAPADDVAGIVTAKEMEKLYDRHMARSKARGRPIYDKLMIAAPHDQCPFCGHRNVSTLDHTLPKAQHPTLAVTPICLIPCCKDCNHTKGNLVLGSAEEQLLNAYYDDVENERWLYAEIVEGSPPGAKFFVETPEEMDIVIACRIENHFETLDLAKLYASQAGRQLQNMKGALAGIYDAAGFAAVRQDLQRRAASFAEVSVNSWEGTMLEAAAASDWYCDGGFRA
ncbi:MAG: LITAF-like zinc ribbon domain-containing protein [Sphingomonas sp.]|jgi:hypothetical protein|uniref:LITAF-like zinc ribbon domain-containing protein n=1 Tax=Sphingomonas sp. TaxID=28214 RepID=UPI0035672F1E